MDEIFARLMYRMRDQRPGSLPSGYGQRLKEHKQRSKNVQHMIKLMCENLTFNVPEMATRASEELQSTWTELLKP